MNLQEYIAERERRDPAFRQAREALRPEFEFRSAVIQARVASGLTQAQLAERMGTKQPAIARLEAGQSVPTLDTIRRLARALDVSFEITPDAIVKTHPVPATT
ncbi:MAG: helix-turn-helix domain-containing protein [Thermomicrobiales bacterium]